eukprot:snap_masked-scaffold_3-processed-gene-20.5-mRNA-1 protein AED:1.00 eAED:1.00 QI:0/0/0/0/1/1/2/0/61
MVLMGIYISFLDGRKPEESQRLQTYYCTPVLFALGSQALGLLCWHLQYLQNNLYVTIYEFK